MDKIKKFINSKVCFIIRLFITTMLLIVIPMLWVDANTTVFKGNPELPPISVAGLIVLVILIGEFVMLLKYYLDGMKTKYSYLKQIIEGLLKMVVPFIVAWVVLTFFKNNIDDIIKAVKCWIPCTFVAVFINPLPKWKFENNVDGLIDITSKLFVRNKEGQEQ